MAATNIDQVLKLMEQKQISFFKVSDALGKNVSYIQDDEDIAPAEALEELHSYINSLEAGIVTIQLSEKSFKQKNAGGDLKTGNYIFKVRVGSNVLKTPNNISGITEDYKDLLKQNFELQNKLMLLEHQRKTDEQHRKLEEKIEGLKNNDPLEKYAPLIQMALGKMFIGATDIAPEAAAAVTGIAGTEEAPTDNKTKLVGAINRLSKIDKNLAENLEALAIFAEKNPDKYFSFIQMLKVM